MQNRFLHFIISSLAWYLCATISTHAETVSGTAFAVTADGILITNDHVINECEAPIKARIEGSSDFYYVATVVASDTGHDLAALKLQRRVGQNIQDQSPVLQTAIFRKGPPVQQGDKAITYGFPLRGLLATNGNLTSGYVSALSGLGDDRNFVQITTPIQQGNSGGPLYDGSGHVIGVIVAKLNALGVMFATGDVPQNVNFAVAIGAVRQFLQNNNIQVTEEDSTTELPLPEIAKKAKLSTYLIECGTRDDAIALRSTLEPAPVSPSFRDAPRLQPIPVDLSKLKFSDIRRPYPELYPQVFEFSVSNAGSDPVSELTIAFRRIQGQPCSRNLQEYDGFKKFSVNLPSGDSVTVRDEFSAQAVSFCIVRAVGPPVGLAACSNPKLAADVGITACTSVIQTGELPAASLAAAYLRRRDRYENVGEYEKAIADYTQVVRLGAQSPDAFSQVSWYVFTHRGWAYAKINDYDRAIRDSSEAIRLNPRSEKSLFVRAYSSVRKGDYDRAISDFTEMIRLDAKSGIAFSGRPLCITRKVNSTGPSPTTHKRSSLNLG